MITVQNHICPIPKQHSSWSEIERTDIDEDKQSDDRTLGGSIRLSLELALLKKQVGDLQSQLEQIMALVDTEELAARARLGKKTQSIAIYKEWQTRKPAAEIPDEDFDGFF